MKKSLAAIAMLAGMTMGWGRPLAASDIVFPSQSIINGVQAVTGNTDVDLNANHADEVSVQVVYSSASTTPITFGDGAPGSGSLTVATLTGLTTAYASDHITFSGTNSYSGSRIWLNGQLITEGVQWTKGTTSTATAIAFCNYIQKAFVDVLVSTANTTSAIVYSTATTAGSAANSFTCVSSTQSGIACASANFTGGQNNAVVTLDNVKFTANTDWFVGASTTATAANIAAAITTKLGSVITTSTSAAVCTLTATTVGANTNYPIASSTAAITTVAFTGGTDSNITYSATQNGLSGLFNYSQIFPGSQYGPTNTIKVAPTTLGTASPLLLSKTAGTYPGPLVGGTTYFASNLTATTFQIADTSTGAVAGVSLLITTATAAGGGAFKLTPLALTGTPVMKLQKSNDDVNFTDVYVSTNPLVAPFQASISFASTYTSASQQWDLGSVAYRWLRFVYTAGTQGAVQIKYIINGKRK